jgi:hypothetical protein
MRKLIIFFLAVSLFAACNNDKGKVNRDDRRSDRETDDYRDKDEDNKDSDSRDKWSSADVSTFNRECEKTLKGKDLTDDQKDEVCSCLLGKFQDKYSTYDELDRKGTEEEGKALAESHSKGAILLIKNPDGSWAQKEIKRTDAGTPGTPLPNKTVYAILAVLALALMLVGIHLMRRSRQIQG